jgi:hypothetical protein
MLQTKLIVQPQEVDKRLADFGVTRSDVIRIALSALGARNDSTPADPKTAKGQFSYIYGVRTLRQVFTRKGVDYEPVSRQNIESVYDAKNQRKIMFQTAETACRTEDPRAISDIGAAKETVIENSNQFLFPEMEDAARQHAAQLTDFQRAEAWYLCTAFVNDTVACELSLPAGVEDKQFSGFIERIFILREGDDGAAGMLNLEDEAPPIEIKPLVRKR